MKRHPVPLAIFTQGAEFYLQFSRSVLPEFLVLMLACSILNPSARSTDAECNSGRVLSHDPIPS
jgi:hypothetical protein